MDTRSASAVGTRLPLEENGDELVRAASREGLGTRTPLDELGKDLACGVLHLGEIAVDFERVRVRRAGIAIAVAPGQLRLLTILILSYPKPASRRLICEDLWGGYSATSDDCLRTAVRRLRRRLCSTGLPDPIVTIRHGGYAIRPLEGFESTERTTSSKKCHAKEDEVSRAPDRVCSRRGSGDPAQPIRPDWGKS
jgi:DNA-binding winged helix-turn-helix (wHTH) protein